MDGPQIERICRLCYECHADYIEIHGVRGKQLAMAEILSKHFDYEQVIAACNDSATIVLANFWCPKVFRGGWPPAELDLCLVLADGGGISSVLCAR